MARGVNLRNHVDAVVIRLLDELLDVVARVVRPCGGLLGVVLFRLELHLQQHVVEAQVGHVRQETVDPVSGDVDLAGAQRSAALLVLRLRGDRAGGQGQLALAKHLRDGTGAVEHAEVGRADDLKALRADVQLESLITQFGLLRCIQRERDVFARR